MHVHLVFVLKYRRPAITERVLVSLREIFTDVCTDFGATLDACDGERDHVHLLVRYPTAVSVARLANSLKGVSSRLIRAKRYSEITQVLYGRKLWAPSYFAASCGGAPLDIIKRYVDSQDGPTS